MPSKGRPDEGAQEGLVRVYHVFADNRDTFTEDAEEAVRVYAHYAEEHGDSRLYEEIYRDREAMENDEMLTEDCLLATGEFPT